MTKSDLCKFLGAAWTHPRSPRFFRESVLSIHNLLQLLHGDGCHGLRCWLSFEAHALLRERVVPIRCFRRGLVLQLQLADDDVYLLR